MAYEATFSMSLGTSNTGIADLRAQLIDDSGANVGSAISTGFVEIDNGFYQWNYTSIPDGHRGGVRFYSAASSGVTLSFGSINPEELENTDSKTSQIWHTLTSGLTTAGSAGKLLVDKLNLITSPISQTAIGTADLTITRAVTLDGVDITGIIVPVGWLKCYFTVKANVQDDLDEQSIIQIVVSSTPAGTDGLLYLNGATGTLADGTLAVGASDVTVTLEDDATALLEDCQGLVFDVKFLIGSSKSTVPKRGTVDIALTATRTV